MKSALAALALAATVLVPTSASAGSSYADSIFPRGLPHAVSEDSCASVKRCVWDARHQGNRDGQSVILTRYQGGFLMTPVSHRRAHWLQAQFCDRPGVACGYGE